MKKTSLSWNVAAVGVLLGASLAAALGCPSAPPSDVNAGAARRAASPPQPRKTVQANPAVDRSPAAEPSGDAQAVVVAESRSSQPGDAAYASHNDASNPAESHSADAPSATPPSEESLFENWPEPLFALFISGRQHGYIEPCGCTGLSNQKGGLARRHTLYQQLIDRGWNVVPVDAGNQVRRYGRQPEIKFHVTSEALKKMDYEAVAFGPDDLRLSAGELMAAVTESGDDESPFLCANASLFGLTKTHRVIETAGKKIGVTAVLGSERLKKLQGDEIVKTSPEEGLQQVLPELEAAGCDLLVLLANADYDEAKALTEKFPQFHVVIAAAGAGEPPMTPEEVGDSILILVGEKSMHAGVLAVYDDPEGRFRYQRVALDARFEDSDFMLKLLATYQDTLKSEGLEGLGLRPIQHPSGYEFVGSATCGECHTTAYDVWQNTPHHHATDALVHPSERIEIPRHHDPECLSCHVTGWDPQGYFPYKSGYLSLEDSKHLHGNGCENCHGPGSQHVAAEMGELDLDDDAIEMLRNEMRLPLAQAEKKCLECHDLDNDPNFQKEGAFAEYWEKIKHYGKD